MSHNKLTKIINVILHLIKFDVLYKYDFIKNLLLLFVMLNIFLYFFSENIKLIYNSNTFILFCSLLTFLLVYSLWKSIFKAKNADGYNKSLTTLPIKSDYTYFSLLILLYSDILIFYFISILLYLIFFKGEFFAFFVNFSKQEMIVVVLITLIFIITINRLEVLMKIIVGLLIMVFFIYAQELSIKDFIRLSNIMKTVNLYIVIYGFAINIILVIIGVFIYRERHYREV